MINVLYSVGINTEDIESVINEDNQGVKVNVVSSVGELITALINDSYAYNYVVICVKAFYSLGDYGTEEEVFKKLQSMVAGLPNTQFAFLDENNYYKALCFDTCGSFKNMRYLNVSKLTLRIYKTALKKILEGSKKQEPKVLTEDKPIVEEKENKQIQRKVKSPNKLLSGIFKKKEKEQEETYQKEPQYEIDKKELVENIEKIKKSTKKELEQNLENQIIDEKENEHSDEQEINNNVDKEILEIKEEPKVKKLFNHKKIKQEVEEQEEQDYEELPEINNSLNTNLFKNRSILITSITNTGATSVALSMAKQLANSDMNVCYVQLAKNIFTSNIYVNPDCVLLQEVLNPISQFMDNTVKDLSECVGVFDNLHFLRDSIDSEVKYNSNSLARMISILNKSFDCVVYDMDFSLVKEYQSVLAMFTNKYLVMNNSYYDIVKNSYYLTKVFENVEDTIIYNSLSTNFGIIVNNYSSKNKYNGETITKDKVLSLIVDINNDLSDMEFAPIIAVIPYSGYMRENPLSQQSTKLWGNLNEAITGTY